MSRGHGQGKDPNDMFVSHLKMLIDLCPAGRWLALHTTSSFLIEETDKFRGLIESGTIGEVWDQVHTYWKNNGYPMKNQGKLIGVVERIVGEFPQQSATLEKHSGERTRRYGLAPREVCRKMCSRTSLAVSRGAEGNRSKTQTRF
jgi:hypothetical protein